MPVCSKKSKFSAELLMSKLNKYTWEWQYNKQSEYMACFDLLVSVKYDLLSSPDHRKGSCIAGKGLRNQRPEFTLSRFSGISHAFVVVFQCVHIFVFLVDFMIKALWMWGMTPPPAMVALIKVSSSSSPLMASWRCLGVILFTLRSLEALPASSRTSAVRYSRMAAL